MHGHEERDRWPLKASVLQQHRDGTTSSYSRNKWWGMANNKTRHCRQCTDEDASHFRALEILRCQHKSTYASVHQGCSLNSSITNARILCENNPSSSSNFRKPLLISGSWGKMVIMNSDFGARLAKGFSNGFSPKVAIREENEGTMRLRSGVRTGWLPRFRAVLGHSRPLIHRPIRRPCTVQQSQLSQCHYSLTLGDQRIHKDRSQQA
jgi:hypothetical protein